MQIHADQQSLETESMQFLVIISFIKLILLKIRVRNVKFQIYEWQRVTGNGVFHYFYETRHWQWRVCFLYIQNAQRLSISLRGVWTKRATGSGALPFVYLKFYISHSYF
jgi:hypothetical protein